jgi:AcrR family transcriptional regulator
VIGMTSDSASERIIAVATRLFAALGYDGTSTRLIAESAGLNIATVAYHVGGKRDLYLAVMERAYMAERAALESAVQEFVPTPEGILRLVDRYVDFCVERPEVPALWMHRWMSDAADVAHLENLYVRPLLGLVIEAVNDAVPPGTDVEYALWSVIWCVHGFGAGGVLDESGGRRRMDDPKALIRFRAHLHTLVTRLLFPSGDVR